MEKVKLIIKKFHPKVKIPTLAYDLALGFDIYPYSVEKVSPGINAPGTYTIMFSTGLAIKIPEGYGVILKERSASCKWKNPSILRAGVIDADYTGEWKIIFNVHCSSSMDALTFAKELVKSENAICQGIVQKKYDVEFEVVNKLDSTKRGDKGFGSSDT